MSRSHRTLCGIGAALIGATAIAQSASAQDAMLGSWKLDVVASRFAGPHSKSQSQLYRLLPNGRMEMVYSERSPDGANVSLDVSWPKDGGLVRDLGHAFAPNQTFVETMLGPGDWLTTEMQDGRQTSSRRKTVSADNRSMRQVLKEIGPDGKVAETILVLRRQ
jgi:hypothetical protein